MPALSGADPVQERPCAEATRRRLNPEQRASVLRRRIHKAAMANDLPSTNAALGELYAEGSEAPLYAHGVNRPETFAPLVEATAIAIVLKHEEYADEMWDNIKHLRRGYKLSDEDFVALGELMEACISATTLAEADALAADLLQCTALAGRVRPARHAE